MAEEKASEFFLSFSQGRFLSIKYYWEKEIFDAIINSSVEHQAGKINLLHSQVHWMIFRDEVQMGIQPLQQQTCLARITRASSLVDWFQSPSNYF